MDIDAATANSHTQDDGQQLSGHAAAHQNLQPDPDMQSVTSTQSHQSDHQQHQHLLLTREAQATSHAASAGASASQGVSHHGHAAESTPAQQTGMSHSFASSAAQLPGFGTSTPQMPGFAGNSGSQVRQGTATGPRHSHGEEEEQGTAPLQHASSTSAMLSLAQQASQASWASQQQQAAKRHSRHTGQCTRPHTVPCSLTMPAACQAAITLQTVACVQLDCAYSLLSCHHQPRCCSFQCTYHCICGSCGTCLYP